MKRSAINKLRPIQSISYPKYPKILMQKRETKYWQKRQVENGILGLNDASQSSQLLNADGNLGWQTTYFLRERMSCEYTLIVCLIKNHRCLMSRASTIGNTTSHYLNILNKTVSQWKISAQKNLKI